jgi:signal transduction histidine kinase
MVADLLNLSRIESSPSQFKPHELNLRELLGDVHARFSDRLREKTLEWQLDLPPQLHTVEGNLHLLRLILDNLVDNAIKFTEPGGHIRVVCRMERPDATEDRRLLIEVTDDGCGIPDADQARVFERFYQVERARSGPSRGTGLGLSIVRHAVTAMRGTVELVSRLGIGTNVSIRIPQDGLPAVPRQEQTVS